MRNEIVKSKKALGNRGLNFSLKYVSSNVKKLRVNIDDADFQKYNFTSEDIGFQDLRDKLENEFAKEAIMKCNAIAREHGFSDMSLEDIEFEIQAIRNAKNNP